MNFLGRREPINLAYLFLYLLYVQQKTVFFFFCYLHRNKDVRATGQSVHHLDGERLWPADTDSCKDSGWNLATMPVFAFPIVS